MSPNDSDPFASTESYYADHRPRYGDSAIEYLVHRFGLADSSRVLDLGCGAGHVALALAGHVGSVVGMDPNREMLREARKSAERAGHDEIEWVVGSDAELDGLCGRFDLTTMGRSFHWMDHERTLESLYATTVEGGGISLLGDDEWFTRGTKPWQDDVYALVNEYIRDLPERTGPIEYDDPWDELLAEFGYTDVETATFAFEREWTLASIVGYVFSLSYCSPDTFGDGGKAFESELCALFGPDETFVQDAVVTVITARK